MFIFANWTLQIFVFSKKKRARRVKIWGRFFSLREMRRLLEKFIFPKVGLIFFLYFSVRLALNFEWKVFQKVCVYFDCRENRETSRTEQPLTQKKNILNFEREFYKTKKHRFLWGKTRNFVVKPQKFEIVVRASNIKAIRQQITQLFFYSVYYCECEL